MSDPIDLPIDSEDRLYDPPLVDCAYRDPQRRGFAITFVPSDDVSSAATEFVLVPDPSPEFTQIEALWAHVAQLLNPSAALDRVVHGGGGDYSILLTDRSRLNLADSDNAAEISDRLKRIADLAEIAFRIERRRSRPSPKIA
ncbi:MAG: hypothetical protein ACAI43_21240 [Phycisphaerae bacterium]|nr:hypothetical protein [Tepidisphaeraceae bacterium]